MRPGQIGEALERLEIARRQRGMEPPAVLLPAPTDAEFVEAERLFGFDLPASIREWFQWRNGVPMRGNSYEQQLLVGHWEHLSLFGSIELVEVLTEAIQYEEYPPDFFHCLVPLLSTDNQFLFVDVRTEDLSSLRMDLLRFKPFLDGDSGLLNVIDSLIEQVRADS